MRESRGVNNFTTNYGKFGSFGRHGAKNGPKRL
jgi:hypothetical protein